MSRERSRSIERIQKSGTPQVEVLSKLACVAGGMACAKIKFWRRGGIVGAREIKFWPRSRQKRAEPPEASGETARNRYFKTLFRVRLQYRQLRRLYQNRSYLTI